MAVHPLPIRDEQPPDDAVVVIRAGVMAPDTLARAARQCYRDHGVYGISVAAVIGISVDEACRTSPRLQHYRHIRLSTFGRLRQGNVTALATFTAPHFTVLLPDLSELTLARLERCFDPPIPNPGLSPRG